MNQAILFSDNETFNAASLQMEFQALSQGTLITCIISIKDLYKMNEQKLPEATMLSESIALTLFESARFDIEELAEQLIHEQTFHEDGKIYL